MTRLPMLQQRARAVALVSAEAAGRSVNRVPGLAGAVCATAAAWDGLGRPAGLAVAAVFFLLVDRRTP